jgi:hypothetical protein
LEEEDDFGCGDLGARFVVAGSGAGSGSFRAGTATGGTSVILEKASEMACLDGVGSLGEFRMMTDPSVSPLSELDESELLSESESSESELSAPPPFFDVGDELGCGDAGFDAITCSAFAKSVGGTPVVVPEDGRLPPTAAFGLDGARLFEPAVGPELLSFVPDVAGVPVTTTGAELGLLGVLFFFIDPDGVPVKEVDAVAELEVLAVVLALL